MPNATQDIPRIPLQTPMFEQGPDGKPRLTRTWIIFFEHLGISPAAGAQTYTITWGAAIGGSLTVANDTAPWFVVRVPGRCVSCTVVAKTAPNGSNAIFDIRRRSADGKTVESILAASKLVLPANSTALVEQPNFARDPMELLDGDTLMLDVVQIGSSTPGGDVTIELLVQPD